MPQTRLEYSIILSSPSDLVEERKAAHEIVNEVSRIWGVQAGVTLRLLSWEQDVAPQFGIEPQAVINEALGDDWDVYLGMMHAHFGSPTKRFGSGTEEEFERAYEIWQSSQGSRTLMFYFKTAAIDINCNIEQLVKVQNFKKRVSSMGGLYKEFQTVETFKDLLRAHLTSVLSALHDRHKFAIAASSTSAIENLSPVTVVSDEESEAGLLDLMEITVIEMSKMTSAIEEIGAIATNMSQKVNSASARLDHATASGDLVEMRRVISLLSSYMRETASQLADARRDYATASTGAMEAFSVAVGMAKSASFNGLKDGDQLSDTISSAISMLEGFTSTIRNNERIMETLPNFAKDFNSARVVLKREFSALRSEMNSSLSLMKDLKDMIAN